MAQKFLCQSVNKAGGIYVVHITSDSNPALQPTEYLINTPEDKYRAGDMWLCEMTLLHRRSASNGKEV